MQPFLIVAYGNTLRSDDGVAWRVAELLRARLSLSNRELLCTHQLVPELAESISHVEHAVFIDASVNGLPGEIACSTIDRSVSWTPTAHRLSPEQIVALCKQSFGMAPEATIVSMTGEYFELGENLSRSVEAALPQLADTVIGVIRQRCATSVERMTQQATDL